MGGGSRRRERRERLLDAAGDRKHRHGVGGAAGVAVQGVVDAENWGVRVLRRGAVQPGSTRVNGVAAAAASAAGSASRARSYRDEYGNVGLYQCVQ